MRRENYMPLYEREVINMTLEMINSVFNVVFMILGSLVYFVLD